MPNYSLKPWIDTVAAGLVDDWNKANPDACIREHDRIMSVNGVSGPQRSSLKPLKFFEHVKRMLLKELKSFLSFLRARLKLS